MEKVTTCQICARPIKARTGVIAHHGYQRPWGEGWQTESCFGARYQPYEVACDAMQPYVDMVAKYLEVRRAFLKDLKKNPPEKLLNSWLGSNPEYVERPVDFDFDSYGFGVRRSMPRSYENAYGKLVYTAENDIKHATAEIKKVEKRLSEWAPAKI